MSAAVAAAAGAGLDLDSRLDDYEVTAVPFGCGAPRLRLVWVAPVVAPPVPAVPVPAPGIALLDAYRVSRVPASLAAAGVSGSTGRRAG